MIKFIFRTNINTATIEITARTLKAAMREAAAKLVVKEVNLTFTVAA